MQHTKQGARMPNADICTNQSEPSHAPLITQTCACACCFLPQHPRCSPSFLASHCLPRQPLRSLPPLHALPLAAAACPHVLPMRSTCLCLVAPGCDHHPRPANSQGHDAFVLVLLLPQVPLLLLLLQPNLAHQLAEGTRHWVHGKLEAAAGCPCSSAAASCAPAARVLPLPPRPAQAEVPVPQRP